MVVMRKTLLFIVFLPLVAFAQVLDADAFIDRSLAVMKADSPLQMDYSYKVYDDDGEIVMEDKGMMMLDGCRYALLMNDMKVWCNGETQWSYMESVGEIYVTSSSSEEAQTLSPLSVMENYRNGCSKSVELRDGKAFVAFTPEEVENSETVSVVLDTVSCRLESIRIFMPGQGSIEVSLENYVSACRFAPNVYECPVEDFPGVEIVDMR